MPEPPSPDDRPAHAPRETPPPGASAANRAANWLPPAPRRVAAVRRRLREVYGLPRAPPHHRPVDELVLTVLSQSTSDLNRDVAYGRLRARLPSWEAVRDAPVDVVEEAIRPGGLSRVKAARLREMLGALGDPISLDDLARAPVPVSRDRLCNLPGVGRKTAACVLLFAFGMRDVPVDTHVSRVGARLGLLPERASFDVLHDVMLALTPRGAELELHVNLLRHGRRTCVAPVPRCPECALRRMCPTAANPRSPTRSKPLKGAKDLLD